MQEYYANEKSPTF